MNRDIPRLPGKPSRSRLLAPAWSGPRSIAKGRRAGRQGAALVLAAVGLPLCLTAQASAGTSGAAPACTDVWTNVDGGTWSTASDWSTHAVPGPTTVACITRPGKRSYVVTLGQSTGSTTVASLVVGDTTGRTTETLQVLAGGNSDIHLQLNRTSTVAAQGQLEMSTGAGGGNDFLQGAGALDNYGRFTLLGGVGWSRYLNGPIVNEPGGAIRVAAANLPSGATYEGTGTTLVNRGKIVVAAGSSWDVSGTDYTQTSSASVVNHGTVVFNDSTIQNDGGASVGAPWLLRNGGAIDEGTGAGAASYTVEDSATLSGDIPAGQTITVDGANGGDDRLSLMGNVANRGTLVMTSSSEWQGGANAWLVNGGKTTSALDNYGLIETLPGVGWSRYFLVNLDNARSGVVTFATSRGQTNYFSAQQAYSGTVFNNDGTVKLGAGALVALEGVSFGQADFAQSASGKLEVTASRTNPSVVNQYGCSAGGCQKEYVRLGGSLKVSGSATSDYPVISQYAPVSGTFSSVTAPYTVTYNSTGGAPPATVGDVLLTS